MNKRLVQVVKDALANDNTIVVPSNRIEGAKGFTEAHMEYIGLKRNDLKKLERHGLALRGYGTHVTQSKLGRQVAKTQTMWILVGAAIPEEGTKNEQI